MKRFLRFLPAIILVAAAAILFGASAEESVAVREKSLADYGSCETHVFPDEYIVINEATCVSTGSEFRTCSVCGYIENVTIPKNPGNHTRVTSDWTYDPAPTCTTSGTRFHFCLDCNAQTDVQEVPAEPEAHVRDGEYEILTPATCVSVGEKAYRCKLCGEYFDRQEIPVTPENHVTSDTSVWEVTVMPTCAVDGEMVCYCDLCGQIARTKPVTATGKHEPAAEWTVDREPTCTTDGIRSHHCLVCDAPVDEEILPAQPDVHTFADDFTVDLAPTCVAEGSKSRHCIYCDAKTDEQVIPIDPKGHSYSDEWIVTQEATCSEYGLMHQVCQLCGEPSVSTLIPKTEHTYGDYEVLQESADGMSMQVQYICEVCGYHYVTVLVIGEDDNNGYIGDEKDNPLNKLHMPVLIEDSILTLDTEKCVIGNIARRMPVSELVENFANKNEFVLYDAAGNFAAEDAFVGTGFSYCYDAAPDDTPSVFTLSVTGDVDSDGDVTSSDARIILRAVAGLEKLENEYFVAADVNCDGKVTAQDARSTLRVAALLDYFDATYKNSNRE